KPPPEVRITSCLLVGMLGIEYFASQRSRSEQVPWPPSALQYWFAPQVGVVQPPAIGIVQPIAPSMSQARCVAGSSDDAASVAIGEAVVMSAPPVSVAASKIWIETPFESGPFENTCTQPVSVTVDGPAGGIIGLVRHARFGAGLPVLSQYSVTSPHCVRAAAMPDGDRQ